MKPLVSVITLTYKNYDKLFDTIKSVLTQDYPNIEYIIADDASGDFPRNEVEKCIKDNNKYGIKYKIIINEENLGIVRNFNNAINHSSGDYVFPLSGNDIFYNDHVIKDIVEVFTKTSCKMVITSRVLYENNKIKCIYPHLADRKRICELDSRKKKYIALMLTKHYGMYIGCNMYYEKKSLENNGFFDEKYKLLEDLPILEKFLWNEDVELKPEIISISYDAKTGVTLKRHKAHSLLQKDIALYNKTGRLAHYEELDKKTQNHIDFGIKRAEAGNSFHMALICFRYMPRIISYIFYCIKEKIIERFERIMINALEDKQDE